MRPARPHARTPGRLLLALALTLVLGACAGPAPPAPGTPGLDLRTPLPYTPVPLPPTAPPAALPTATPLPAASPVSGTRGPAPTADTALPRLVITNTAGTPVALYVELAITPDQQETGLMHRTAMAEDQGMLFVFPSETTVPFWMKDTLLPLTHYWRSGMGLIIIALALAFPDGLIGTLAPRLRRLAWGHVDA